MNALDDFQKQVDSWSAKAKTASKRPVETTLSQWEIYGMLAALYEMDGDTSINFEREAMDATSESEWNTNDNNIYMQFADGEDCMLEEIAKHWPNERKWLQGLV